METQNIKKLYRSVSDKWIAGVCGGIAEYLNIDSIIIRLFLILLTLFGGTGIIFYIIAWIMIPTNPYQTDVKYSKSSSQTWGIILLIIGIFLLLKNLELVPFNDMFEWFDFMSWGTLISIVLIITGVILIVNQVKHPQVNSIGVEKNQAEVFEEAIPPKKKVLRKSSKEKKISGVCGGLAEYLEIDVTIVRLIFVLITLSSFGLGIFLYIILAIIMPKDKNNI